MLPHWPLPIPELNNNYSELLRTFSNLHAKLPPIGVNGHSPLTAQPSGSMAPHPLPIVSPTPAIIWTSQVCTFNWNAHIIYAVFNKKANKNGNASRWRVEAMRSNPVIGNVLSLNSLWIVSIISELLPLKSIWWSCIISYIGNFWLRPHPVMHQCVVFIEHRVRNDVHFFYHHGPRTMVERRSCQWPQKCQCYLISWLNHAPSIRLSRHQL